MVWLYCWHGPNKHISPCAYLQFRINSENKLIHSVRDSRNSRLCQKRKRKQFEITVGQDFSGVPKNHAMLCGPLIGSILEPNNLSTFRQFLSTEVPLIFICNFHTKSLTIKILLLCLFERIRFYMEFI